MATINLLAEGASVQDLAEVVAALELANERLESDAVRRAAALLRPALAADGTHYLFLRVPDDLASFFGCGSASGGADTMVEDKRTCRLYSIPLNECPNCQELRGEGVTLAAPALLWK